MLIPHHKPVSFSLVSTDLPVWSALEASARLYQREPGRFHLLLSEPNVRSVAAERGTIEGTTVSTATTSRLLWLEISPSRVIMTMQGKGLFSYRHLWERGMYGISRYWLRGDSPESRSAQMRLRNYTRSLTLTGHPLPEHLRLEYELWSEKVALGRYVLDVEILH